MWSIWISALACAYLLFYINKTRLRVPNEIKPPLVQGKVTLLVCLHNEAAQIDAFISTIAQQDCQNKQLLIVNDRSTDGSTEKLKEWKAKFPAWIDIINLEQKEIPGKKGAIKSALPHIKGDYILFTDVDCRPQSTQWMNRMIAPLDAEEAPVVLGYVQVKTPLSSLGILLRFQSFWKSIQFLGFAQRQWAYMAMGGNWAVNTETYLNNQNINQHAHIASGDDDLTFQALDVRRQTRVVLDPKAWVKTNAEPNFWTHIRQRGRHMSTFSAYDWKWNLLLLSAPLVMLIGLVALIFSFGVSLLLSSLLLVTYYLICWGMMAASAKVIPAQFPVFLGPILLPFEFLFQGIGFLVTLSRKQSSWT